MRRTKQILRGTGLLAALYCAAATAENSYVLGPVEHIAQDGSSLTVLGQTYAAHLGNFGVSDLQLGEYVLLVGEPHSNGEHTAVTLDRALQPYVPGASEVFLSGSVSKTSQLTGYLTIGEVSVYVAESNLLASVRIEVGDTLEIVGSQALPLGPVWAREVRVVKGMVVAQGIQGTGSLGIQGTGALGIQGTGALGIQGTGTQGIQGTGKQGIQGTGALGIQGTGALGIQGTGTQGIQGTGKQGIQGTGALGIQGTGALGIQGTGTQGIQGTGKLGIEGTGIQGIQGTGSLGIQGTGTFGIQGTGAAL